MNTSWWRNVTHFTAKEFACPETGEALVSCDLVVMLDKARTFTATPFTITSGYRSPAHNRKVGGVPGSAHTKGLAAD
ncbi:MAG: peptidase M15, partial [Desulfovibrio sp.]